MLVPKERLVLKVQRGLQVPKVAAGYRVFLGLRELPERRVRPGRRVPRVSPGLRVVPVPKVPKVLSVVLVPKVLWARRAQEGHQVLRGLPVVLGLKEPLVLKAHKV